VSPELLNVVAAGMSALAAFVALGIGMLSLRETRRAECLRQLQTSNEKDAAFMARLEPMYPDLRRLLGHVEDGVPYHVRNPLISFFILYADAFAAHRDGLLDDRDWESLGGELAYWAQKPTARRAWRAFRRQTWAAGFVDHVDSVMAGPPAYPDIIEEAAKPPDVNWPDDAPSHDTNKPI
jgi:hypothetical protein